MPESSAPSQSAEEMVEPPSRRQCIVVLHDDRLSSKDILCGADVLRVGELGFLTAGGAKALCICPAGVVSNPEQVSIHASLAERFGLENRLAATVEPVHELNTATATHVELLFHDQYLSRADMWHVLAGLNDRVLYRGQTVNYLDMPTAEVQKIYISGRDVDSAIVSHPQTKPIFRSGSARYTILVELSEEMLERWHDGEIMYERVVGGFLPELFRRWSRIKARHLVSIVLFGRSMKKPQRNDEPGHADNYEDFFYVVAPETLSTHWTQLLRKLKRALNTLTLSGSLSLATDGNMLEAIHLAAVNFADDQTNVLLTSTGNSIIVVTAGTGIFRATHHLLTRTTDLLVGNSIGVDVVALSPKPLHPSPLFKYVRDGNTEYALPHWIDISFWELSNCRPSTWVLPETEAPLKDVSVPPILRADYEDSSTSFADVYDDEIFRENLRRPQQALVYKAKIIDQKLTSAVETIEESDVAGQYLQRKLDSSRIQKVQAPAYTVRSTSDRELTQRTKKPILPPNPLLPGSRKISLGPKGLALSRGVASTTISSAYAQHGKDPPGGVGANSNDTSSELAKAIRASLARKPSQQSLASRRNAETDSNQSTQPIDILANQDAAVSNVIESDGIIEKDAVDGSPSVLENGAALSLTPKAIMKTKRSHMDGPDSESISTPLPWVTLLNPCNPRRDNMQIAGEYRQWQHIFPRAVTSADFKWASLCSTAALPTTVEYRPSLSQLETHFSKKVRRHVISQAANLQDESASSLMDKLIDVRLIRGFQIVAIGHGKPDKDYPDDRSHVLLALGRRYHEVRRISNLEMQILQFEPKVPSESGRDHSTSPIPYSANISTPTSSSRAATLSFDSSTPSLDWGPLDDYIMGLSPLHDTKAFFKLRLVLIPVEPSRGDNSVYGRMRELSEDERRIEGIQRLTQIWQRQRYFSAEDQLHQVSLAKRHPNLNQPERDPNPLAIEYQTRDPSVVVNAQGLALTNQLTNGERFGPLFAESDKHHSSNFDVTKLVKQMQELPPYGVEMRDRRWLTQTHLKCFRGDEMTTWLLGVFKDLQFREDAADVGNELMKRGLFTHVRQKHKFRDGHYFYQITGAYRSTDYPDSTGLFSKVPWRSIPATPIAESATSPIVRPLSNDSSSSDRATPVIAPTNQKQLLLSQVLQYNVDPARRSQNLQIIDLHYDQIHNPENCYHIQLEWLTASAKLIREAVTRWSGAVESYGLKLVQVPTQEASKFPYRHPFDQPQPIKLALPKPANESPMMPTEAHEMLLEQVEDRTAVCQFLLRRHGFILDYEAASWFTDKLQVSYSWGPPNYTYTQFVHRSGLVLAQVVVEETTDMILLPNPLAHGRLSGSISKQADSETAEGIMKTFRTLCSNEGALKDALRDFTKQQQMASPFSPQPLAEDHDVPPLNLTPRTQAQGRRDGS